MNAIAGIAVISLFGAIGWSVTHPVTDTYTTPPAKEPSPSLAISTADEKNLVRPVEDTATSTTPLGDAIAARFGMEYASLASKKAINAASVTEAADIRPIISYTTYTDADILSDQDTSLSRVLTYRAELRVALEPLIQNTTPELDIYAQYVETRDPAYLSQLHAIAKNYRAAGNAAAHIRVPADAVHLHVGILNAMSSFAAALDALANNANDPVGSVALLRTYNTAENAMLTSFDSLGRYAAAKTQ